MDSNMNLSMKCAFSIALVAIIGCGGSGDTPDIGTVTGTITIDGKAMPDVSVTFSPVKGGRASSGITDSSGHYKLTYSSTVMGAKIGNHKVFVAGYVDYDPNDPEGPMEPPEGNVPKKYSEIEKRVEVKAGSNEIDLSYP